MKRVYVFSIFIIFIYTSIHSQNRAGKVSNFKIIDVKGKVFFNSRLLNRDTVIRSRDINLIKNSITYSTKTDFVKLKQDNNSSSQMMYALQQIASTDKNMSIRGSNAIVSDIDLIKCFQKPYYIWDSDTLIIRNPKYKADSTHCYLFSYNYKGKEYNFEINKRDTIIFNKELFYIENKTGVKERINSLEIENISIVYYNKLTYDNTYIAKNNLFILVEDYIKFLKNGQLNNDEIFMELSSYCINVNFIKEKYNLNDTEAKKWLLNKINSY